MQFIKSQSKTWLEKAGYSKKIFLDEKSLPVPGALVQKIKIKPGEIAENHYHKKQTEIFYFLNTQGFFRVNGENLNIEIGDVLVIEPFDRHEVGNNSSKDFLYMAFKLNYTENDLFWETDKKV